MIKGLRLGIWRRFATIYQVVWLDLDEFSLIRLELAVVPQADLPEFPYVADRGRRQFGDCRRFGGGGEWETDGGVEK